MTVITRHDTRKISWSPEEGSTVTCECGTEITRPTLADATAAHVEHAVAVLSERGVRS